MTLTVFTISGAPRPWRVLLGLAFKGLSYDIRYLDGSKREHKSGAFLRLNPRGTVPVLETENLRLADSLAILAWLDRAYTERPLFGATTAKAGEIWQATMESCDFLCAACHALLHPVFFSDVPAKPPELAEAAGIMGEELHRLEVLLGKRPFLIGETPTAADAVSFPEVRLLQRAIDTRPDLLSSLELAPLAKDYPRVAAWLHRVEALDGVDRTMPPHWTA